VGLACTHDEKGEACRHPNARPGSCSTSESCQAALSATHADQQSPDLRFPPIRSLTVTVARPEWAE
jgi:hypothetical protein